MAKRKRVKPNILELLKEGGINFSIVKIEIDQKVEREVKKYVQKIEEAHHRAAKSKLHFP